MAKSKPVISVIERRLQGPDVFRTSSQPIPLREPKAWELRWVHTKINTGHLWDILHHKGWEYAAVEDIACPVDEIGAFIQDGRIVRGERGDEVLCKMRRSDYRAISARKSRDNVTATFGKQAIKNAMVEGVASQYGDQAATFVHQRVETIQVADTRGDEG